MSEIGKIMEEQRKVIKLDKAAKKGKIADKKSPFSGSIKLRGRIFRGVVVSKDTHRTARVEWTLKRYIRKYERFMVKKSKVAVHNPIEIDAMIGDVVVIAECRPLSKTKKFIIIKNLGHSKDYIIKKESIDEDKKVTKEVKQKSSLQENDFQDARAAENEKKEDPAQPAKKQTEKTIKANDENDGIMRR